MALAALLLSLERVAYALVCHDPAAFRRWCSRPPVSRLGSPVDVVAWLFGGFKLLQLSVFAGWHLWYGDGSLLPHSREPWVLGSGALLVVLGQALNLSVFRRLGKAGVFYGNRLGGGAPWCTAFPFTWFDHPQYVGTVLAIWGLFVLFRFPAPDWIVLPVIETVYYALGAWAEHERPSREPA